MRIMIITKSIDERYRNEPAPESASPFCFSYILLREKNIPFYGEKKNLLFLFFAKIARYIMETNKVDKLYILKGECVMLKDTMKD